MMKNYVCWNPRSVRQVINPFAEYIPDALFRAVHTDWKLQVSPPIGKGYDDLTGASYREFTPADFLKDFMRSDRPHALAAVLGETGSGKSHLIHWMRLTLPKSDNLLILVVKKSGTSLRAIVKMIIDELPENERQGFLDTFNRAGEGTATRGGQKQQLLNDLAFAIREEIVELGPNASELEAELVEQLPYLFQDPYMRDQHFLKDGTVVADIVDHIFATSTSKNRPDQRRVFEESDLPLGGLDYSHASKPAQIAIDVVDCEKGVSKPLAVEIINRNLEKAIARTLSFTGDRVEELMARLRMHLKSQGKELVLLIEEFARLQGIDRALLQAITSQGDDRQCRIRSAIAVTTGFFKSVADTAYMRTTHIVDMNRSAGHEHGKSITREALSTFAARYLNAARMGLDGVERWHLHAVPEEAVPSYCSDCRFKAECHATFGEEEGYGLYPFTRTALWNALTRVDERMPDTLNPRILQNEVLVEVLESCADSIQSGAYPPDHLLPKLKGENRLGSTERDALERIDPNAAPRWITTLELYNETTQIRVFSKPLFHAFDIPEFAYEGTGRAGGEPIGPEVDERTKPSATREDLAIEAWVSGAGLDQNVAETLRRLIFPAVVNAIDWDMIGLERTSFVGSGSALFQRRYVTFDRQTTQLVDNAPIQLRIPGVPSINATGVALKGLIRANKSGFRWDFEGGDQMLSAFLDCLDHWVADVQTQLRQICNPTKEWSQAEGAIQLLCVGAALGNKFKADSSLADIIDAAFGSWPPECQASSSDLREIYRQLSVKREKLSNVARAYISSTKGGQVGAMLSPNRFVGALQAFRAGKWRLSLVVPDGQRGDFRDVAQLYSVVRLRLEEAVRAECEARASWLDRVEGAFGIGATRSTIVSALRAATDAIDHSGVSSGGTAKPLTEVLDRFEKVHFDDAVTASRAIQKGGDGLALLPSLGRGRRNAVELSIELAEVAAKFLSSVEGNLAAFGEDQNAFLEPVNKSLASLDASLRSIEETLQSLNEAGEVN